MGSGRGALGVTGIAVVMGATACLMTIDEHLMSGESLTLEGGAGGARTDAKMTSEGGLTPVDADASTSGPDGGDSGPVTAASACASPRGPATVDAGSFCIDRTEVTQGQYAAFLADKKGVTAGQSALCTWNTTFDPACSFTPTTTPDLPVVCVDWCDADAFCRWADKRLCGGIAGGATPAGGENDARASRWYAACTNGGDGKNSYPYGTTYDATFCVGQDPPNGAVSAVGTHLKCVGGVPGLFDMSGNVNEWEDQCSTTGTPQNDACHTRGGAFTSSPTGMLCVSGYNTPRNDTSRSGLGFRCCGDH